MSDLDRTAFVGVISGKGGVGKTNLAVNVAIAARELGARVLVVDGDLGLANVDVLLGLTPSRSAADVLDGRAALGDVVTQGPRGIHVLPAAAARKDLTALRPRELAALLVPLFRAAQAYDLVLVDTGAGIGPSVLGLAAACERLLLVTTPEPTAFADAYAMLKVAGRELQGIPVELVVNETRASHEARRTHHRLCKLARRFLTQAPPLAAAIPQDAFLVQAVSRQRAVVDSFPSAPSSRVFQRLAVRLLEAPRSRIAEKATALEA
jgi:flagellar biosynthesis protein FlhG